MLHHPHPHQIPDVLVAYSLTGQRSFWNRFWSLVDRRRRNRDWCCLAVRALWWSQNTRSGGDNPGHQIFIIFYCSSGYEGASTSDKDMLIQLGIVWQDDSNSPRPAAWTVDCHTPRESSGIHTRCCNRYCVTGVSELPKPFAESEVHRAPPDES